MLWPLWPFVLIIGLYHGITNDIEAGGEIILRMLIAVALANLVTMTTPLNDMIDVLMRLLPPLNWIGISIKPVALTIALFIRFIPTLIERGITMHAALRARSIGKSGWRIVVPLTLSVLKRRRTRGKCPAGTRRCRDKRQRIAIMERSTVLIAVFAALIAALGLVPKFTLAFGVPITAQSLGIMLCGTVLGAKRGGAAALLFVF